MLRKTIAVAVLAVSLGVTSISPSLAAGPRTIGTGGWTNTNAGAAQSRANLSESVLSPTAVPKIQYLRSITSPVIKPDATCPGNVVAPLPTGGSLYAMTNDLLSKYDPATGKLIWQVTPDSTFTLIYQSLAMSRGLVIVGGIECDTVSQPGGFIEAFDASTGALAWTGYALEGLNQAATVGTSYVVAEGADAAGSDVAVLNLADGKLLWHHFGCLNSDNPNDPVVVGLMVLGYGCDSQGRATIEARHIATGALAWSLPVGWVIQRGDLAGSAGTHLYATDLSGTVVDLNPQTGQVVYSLSKAATVLAVDATRVYATCGHRSLTTDICAYSISTGSLEWQKSLFTSDISMRLAAEADGVLYLATGQALNASTGQVIGSVWGLGTYNFRSPAAIAVGDGRIAVAGDPRVLDLYGLPGS
jgi:outer membrane protein assembly factor BamB